MYNVPLLEINQKLKDISFDIPNYLRMTFKLVTGQECEEQTAFTQVNDEYVLLLKCEVTDRDNPTKKIPLYSYMPIDPSTADAVERSSALARWFMDHEAQEYFFYEGKRFKDPHPTVQETNV